MEPLSAGSLIVMVAFAFTFVSTIRFYRRRLAQTPASQRSMLTPTLIISISFLIGTISTAVSFYSLQTLPPSPTTIPPPSIDVFLPWVLIAELASPLFGFTLMVAVITALKRPRLYILPVSLLIASCTLSFLSPKTPMDDPYLSLWVAAGSLLLVLPMALFGFLWRSTRRPTAFGMFVGLLLYFLYYLFNSRAVSEYVGYLGFYLVPAEYLGHFELYRLLSNLMFIAVFGGVAALSFIYWCFQYSEKKLGGEVIGYSLSIPVIGTEVFMISLSLGIVPIEYSATLLIMAVASGVFILTGSYLYGRYRENKYPQTLMLSAFSYCAGLGYLLFNVGQHIYVVAGRFAWMDLITLPIGMVTGGFLFLAAIYAMERRSLVLLPPLVIVPLLIMALIFYPLPIWLIFTMAGAALLMTILPGTLFGALLRRMSRGKEKGRGRVLGIFMGFLFMVLASPVQILSATVPDPIIFVGSFIAIIGSIIACAGSLNFYFGVSGRLDRWFYERRTK